MTKSHTKRYVKFNAQQYHLDREEVEGTYTVHRDRNRAHVGKRLQDFFDNMFLRGGYMMMFYRQTVQTRNTLYTISSCHF
jgi:hypothetical protein